MQKSSVIIIKMTICSFKTLNWPVMKKTSFAASVCTTFQCVQKHTVLENEATVMSQSAPILLARS